MTETVNMHEARTHLSRLVARAAQGEEIVIARSGRPVARLVGIPTSIRRRVLGSAKGEVVISQDFDKPLPATLRRVLGGRNCASRS